MIHYLWSARFEDELGYDDLNMFTANAVATHPAGIMVPVQPSFDISEPLNAKGTYFRLGSSSRRITLRVQLHPV